MPELVDRFGPETHPEPGGLAREPRAGQAGRGHDGCTALELRLAEDERQDRDEEVRVRQAEDARGPLRPPRREQQERAMRGVLVATHVERVVRPRARELEPGRSRSEEHTSELQSLTNLVCRLL